MREIKRRNAETWEAVRRAWEGGETAASCARRFDVGMANLWRRRAAEDWGRGRAPDPRPEPPEGWAAYGRERMTSWEATLAETRTLALDLASALAEPGPWDASAWHLGWLYAMRAERLGPAVAAQDRDRARGRPWFEAFWDDEGRLRRIATLDWETQRLWRDDWRRRHGLPDGVAEAVPCGAPQGAGGGAGEAVGRR